MDEKLQKRIDYFCNDIENVLTWFGEFDSKGTEEIIKDWEEQILLIKDIMHAVEERKLRE